MTSPGRQLTSFANSAARLTALPAVRVSDPQMQAFVDAVREHLETFRGARGDRFERVITVRDMVDWGLVDPGTLGAAALANLSDATATAQILVQTPAGSVPMSIEAFARTIVDTTLFKQLMQRLNDPTRFDLLPETVRQVLLRDIAADAAARGADLRRTEKKIQNDVQSLAMRIDETTASLGQSVAGVRQTVFASATTQEATAGAVTQIRAAIGDPASFTGGGITLEEVMFGRASLTEGLYGQVTTKIDANGYVAGFGLAVDAPLGAPATSAFIIRADKFALVASSTTVVDPLAPDLSLVPFGVDATGVYINGNVRINTAGPTLDSVASVGGVRVESDSQFFKVDTAGAAVNATVTLTATVISPLTGTVTWTAVPSGQGGTPPTGTNTWAIAAADQTVDAATYTATKVDGSDTYTDSFTIVRLRDGTDAMTAALTNEAHSVPAADNGVVLAGGYTGCGGTMKLYRGATLLTTGVVFSIPSGGNPDGLTASINSSTGVYSVTASGSWPTSSETTTLTLRATHNSVDYDKVFSITKSIAGADGNDGSDGSDAYSVAVSAPAQLFQTNKAGTVNPSSITVTATPKNLAGLGSVSYAWTTSPNIGSGSGTTFNVTNTALSTNQSVTVTVTATVAAQSFTDSITLVRVAEGSDAVTAVLSNEAHTLPSDASGGSVVYTGSGTTIRVFEGSTELTYDGVGTANGAWTVSKAGSSITPGATTDSGLFATIGVHSAMSADVASITYTISGKRANGTAFSFTKQQSFSKSKTGTGGTNGERGSLQLFWAKNADFQKYPNRVSPKAKWAVDGTLSTTNDSEGTTMDTAATSYFQSQLSARGLPTTLQVGDMLSVTHNLRDPPQSASGWWSGTAWLDPGVFIDGNLIVGGSVTALAVDAVYTLSVQGEAITVPRGAITSADTTIAATTLATAQVVLQKDFNVPVLGSGAAAPTQRHINAAIATLKGTDPAAGEAFVTISRKIGTGGAWTDLWSVPFSYFGNLNMLFSTPVVDESTMTANTTYYYGIRVHKVSGPTLVVSGASILITGSKGK